MTAVKRATTIMLSAVILMGSLLTPITAFAQEAATEGNEVYEQPVAVTTEAIPDQPVEEPVPDPVPEAAVPEKATEKTEPKQEETEAPDRMVHLPSYKEAAWMVDEGHVKKRKDEEIILAYKAGDSVKISVSEMEGFELEEIKVIDGKKNEQEFTWESEDTLVFLMPEKDLNVTATFRDVPEETDPAVSVEPADEDGLAPNPAAAIDPGSVNDGQIEAPAEDPETGTGPEETAVSGQEEAAVTEEPAKGTAGGQEDESKDLQIPAIDPETEADGFPVSGSIVRLAEIGIGMDAADFQSEGPFEDATYPQETCRMEMKSNTISYGVPGLYDVIYRVDESTTGKFWYVVRPVRVLDISIEADGVADNQDNGPAADDGKDGEADPEDNGSRPDGETVTEAVTEGNAPLAEENAPEVVSEEETEAVTEESTEGETAGVIPEEIKEDVVSGQEEDPSDEKSSDSIHNIFFDTGEGYSISMENDRLTYQEGDEVTFTVTTDEKHVIKRAAAFVAMAGDPVSDNGENAGKDSMPEVSPILITDEKVAVTQTAAVNNGDEIVEATYEFEMPDESVVLSADVMLAAAASDDITVQLENGSIKNIPKSWTPDGMEWANGRTTIGYSKYRTVTMPDGKERKAYCLQPALGAEDDGEYTATEIRKKGQISAAEAALLRKGIFYVYGGPGWATGEIKDILSDCSSNDEYYVASHYILSKIYCDATSGNWNIATSGGTDYTAMNARGKAQIEAAVAKLKTLAEPSADLSPTQVAGIYNEAAGFAQTQAVTYSSTVTGNTLSITLPANVYLDIAGGASFGPGQKAQIDPGSTFTLRKSGYEAAHQETLACKAAIFTDYDAYLINVGSTKQNMGFSYVADKDFELSVTWPDLLTHLNIVKVDAHTGTASATPGYNMDGAVYGIYADAGKTQLMEQLTISGGSAVSSDSYVIGRTYYIAEISAPAEYAIDPNVYPVIAVAGGTATVTSSDTPKTIKISMQKVDAETHQPRPLTSALSFEGAVFGIYSDPGCTVKAVDINGNAVADIRTDANGHAETPQSLLIGDYYVKELAAPAGYRMNETVFTVSTEQVRSEIVSADANAELTCEEQVIRANMDLIKVKTLKGLSTEAAEGVEFHFTYVNDPSVTFSVIDGMENTVVTDAEGCATTASEKYPGGTLIYGEWEITESNTPEGFESLDPTRFIIAGDGRTYRFIANNRQIHAAVLIEKHDANTGSRIPVGGVKFRLYKDGELVSLFNSTTRVYEDTWVTDSDGMVQLPEMLDYGTYTVVEDPQSIPDGYFVMDGAPLVVDEMADEYLHPITLTAMEPPQLGNIMVEKRDAKTGESLEGFSFEIITAEDITDPAGVIRTGTNADGEEVPLTSGTVVERVSTGKNGNAVSKDLFLGSYTVRETGIQNGYAITKETQTVTIKGDAAKARDHENVSEYVLFKNEPTTVKILKVSSKTGEALEGITFLVHKLAEDEETYDYAWTGEEESDIGEIDAVIGTESEEDGKSDEADSEEDSPEDNTVSGNEDDADGQEPDAGSEGFGYQETGQTSGLDEEALSEDELFVTDESGGILVDYLDADSTYVIREIKTIPGYNLSHELVSFDVDAEGLIDGSFIKEVTMENVPNLVHISKQDITNSEEIPGAKLTITDSEGNVVAEWTSDYEVHEIPALPAGTYTLTEVTAPDGYEETESIIFRVINSRKIQSVVMKDSPFREVEVSKTDITGDKELIGAILAITDKDGNEIESWESTADIHTVKLHSGEYILTERKPADGYATAESIPFTVIKTSASDFDVQGVAMKDDVTKVEITKSDITNGEPVIGAELIISDAKGNELYRWTTTKDPYYIEMLPIGTYTLTEITAPSGYATAETVSFTVEDTGEIQKVDMKDIPISVEISKKDIADGPGGEELPGAHLTVKNENGDVVDDWISTKEPHKISMLPVGKYTLTEVTAPKGYEVAESITFEIADSGEVHKVTMYDSPKEETVDLTGKKKTITKGGGYTPATNGVTSVVTPPVKTGDDSPILLFVLLGLMAVLTGGLAVSLRRKGRIV